MSKTTEADRATPPEAVISIIGPAMRVVGDCETDGTVRIEGRIEGSVKTGKAVVVAKGGVVKGDIFTQDAVISGSVMGTVNAESRLEIQSTARIEGEIHAKRMLLEEGATLSGRVQVGDEPLRARAPRLATSPPEIGASQEVS